MINGENIRKQFVGKTRDEAYKKLVEFVNNIIEHGLKEKKSKPNEASIVSLLKAHEEKRFKNGDIKSNSYVRLKQTIKTISAYKFANQPIQKVTRKQVEVFLQSERVKAEETLKKEFREVKKAFNIAEKKKMISDNYFTGEEPIVRPHSFKVEVKVDALSRTEEFLLNQYLNTHITKYKNIILLSLYTGMRIGEILALTPNDIQWHEGEYGIINVERTITQDKNGKNIIRRYNKNRMQYENYSFNRVFTKGFRKFYKGKER